MILNTLWFWRNNETGPEMLAAWDEWSVDENSQGFQEECEKALASVQGDMSGFGYRYIDIRVDYSKIEQIFKTAQIEGEIEDARP